MSTPKGHPRFRTDDPSRFWEKVLFGDGCWEWQAAKHRQGYGWFGWRGRARLAHRVAWELWHGRIPSDEIKVLHGCDNTGCVRPDHLFLGTQSDNIHDMFAKGRAVSAGASKTHCLQGHAYDEANTYRNAVTNKRTCRTCARDRERRRREEARAS